MLSIIVLIVIVPVAVRLLGTALGLFAGASTRQKRSR